MKIFIQILFLFFLINILITKQQIIEYNSNNNSNNNNNSENSSSNISSSENNELLNIYVNKNGNDNTGNGTIQNPYSSVCKIINLINNNNNNSNQININIGSGEYDCSDCPVILNNYIIKLQPYNNSENSDNNNNELYQMVYKYESDSSKYKFNIEGGSDTGSESDDSSGSSSNSSNNISLINFNFKLNNSNLTTNFINIIYNNNNNNNNNNNSNSNNNSDSIQIYNNSNLNFIKSQIINNNNYNSNNISFKNILINYKSTIKYYNSSINNINIETINSKLIISKCRNMVLLNINSTKGMNIHIEDSEINQLYIVPNNNNNINYRNIVYINNSIIYFNNNIDNNNNNNNFNKNSNYIFTLKSNHGSINISNSKLYSSYSFISNSLIEAYNSSSIIIDNTLVAKWSFKDSVLKLNYNSSILLKEFIIWAEGSVFIESSNSITSIFQVKYYSSDMVLMLLNQGSSVINLCQGYLHYYTSGVPFVINSENNLFNLSFTNFENIANVDFKANNKIQMENMLLYSSNIGKQFLFKLGKDSKFNCNSCLLYSVQQAISLFIQDHSNVILEHSNIEIASIVAVVSHGSNFTIRESSIGRIFSNTPPFQIDHSNLAIENSNFTLISCLSSELVNSIHSNILIDHLHMDYSNLGDSILKLYNSDAKIRYFNMSSSNFQKPIISSYSSSNVVIEDSILSESTVQSEALSFQQNSSLVLQSSTIIGCTFNYLFFINNSKIQMDSTDYSSNRGSIILALHSSVEISSISFDPISSPNILDNKNPLVLLKSSKAFFDRFSFYSISFSSLFFSIINSSAQFSRLSFDNNYHISTFIESTNYSNITVDNQSQFISNYGIINTLFNINSNSLLNLENCFIFNNSFSIVSGDNSNYNIIRINNSSLLMNSSELSNSNSKHSPIASYENSSLQILNSIFKENYVYLNGGVMNLNYPTTLQLVKGSQFISNTCLGFGGVFYTNNFSISKDPVTNNTFLNNSAISGDTIASEPYEILISNPLTFFEFSYISLVDRYYQLVSTEVIQANVTIQKRLLNDDKKKFKPIHKDVYLKGGYGKLYTDIFKTKSTSNFTNIVYSLKITLSNSNIKYYNASFSNAIPCNVYQSYQNDTCTYCNFQQIFSYSKGECVSCPSNMVCLGSLIYSDKGYYAFNVFSTIQFLYTESCPLGLCLPYDTDYYTINTCPSNLYNMYSPFCSSCIEDDSFNPNFSYNTYSSFSPSTSKNANFCCEHFQPLLLIGYIIFIIGFSLVFSLYKTDISKRLVGLLLLTFQYNSIVFYSFPGVYILPLFRFSTDFIFNFCTVRLNFVHKLSITLGSIAFIMFIGLSDVSLAILVSLRKNLLFGNIVNKLLSKDTKITLENYELLKFMGVGNSRSVVGIPTSGQGVIGRYDIELIRFRQFYNFYLVIHQPLVFVSLSLIIPKTIHNISSNGDLTIIPTMKSLAMDFSYSYNSTYSHKVLLAMSIIIIFFFALYIPVKLFCNCFFSHLFEKKIESTNKSLYNNNNNGGSGDIYSKRQSNNVSIRNFRNHNFNNSRSKSFNSNSIDTKLSIPQRILIQLLKFLYNENISKLYKSSNYGHYKSKFRWWDLLIIIKNISISFLTVSLIYKPYHYFLVVVTVQSFYTLLHFTFAPQKKSQNYNYEIMINITNLIVYLVLNSNLLLNTPLYISGLIITFSNLLFLVLFLNIFKLLFIKLKK